MASPKTELDYVICPFTIVIDDREGAPYSFLGRLPCEAPEPQSFHRQSLIRRVVRKSHHRPITRPALRDVRLLGEPWTFEDITTGGEMPKRIIVKTEKRRLMTGDYSIVGFEDRIAVERKERSDAYQSFGRERRRFEAELERLSQMDYAAVLVEDTWDGMEHRPPRNSKMLPESVIESMIAWQQRYGVHFLLVSGRRQAERLCFRVLRRFHRDIETKLAEEVKAKKQTLKLEKQLANQQKGLANGKDQQQHFPGQ